MVKRRRKRIPILRPDAVPAAPPGTLVAPPEGIESRVSVTAYGPDHLEEKEVSDLDGLAAMSRSGGVLWINVVGLGTVDVLTQLGQMFRLHRLALEDVLNIPQRPKLDDYGEHQYIVARMPISNQHLETEQLSIFLADGLVITFQERPGDCFDGIRSRIREGRPRIRSHGADYLVYAILDALVDAYFPVLEGIGTTLDQLEERIHLNADESHLQHLYAVKRELVTLRRYVWPLRELNSTLARPDSSFLEEQTRVYMRDCYDHSVHALELVDSYRDIASGLMDLYLSMASQRMNEVMKVLTIIATLFIPLSFIAGLYGMNFDPSVSRWNMPELGWAFGYPAALIAMGLCAGGMLLYFWKKGWFR